jgi:hypothetical protein
MLTDEQGVALTEDLRRNTQSVAVAALCDWVLALAQRDAVSAARRAHRNEYMKALMRRRLRHIDQILLTWRTPSLLSGTCRGGRPSML